MKKRLVSVLLSVILIFSSFMTTVTAVAAPAKGGGRVIVCLRGEALSTQSAEEDLQWEPLMDVTKSNATDTESGISAQSFGMNMQEESEIQTLFLVTSSTMDNDTLINRLEERADVLFAEADTYTVLDEDAGGIDTNSIPETNWLGYKDGTDLSKFQWHLDSVGNTQKLTGDQSTIVAVMDTGVDYTNPNLCDQMYSFTDTQKKILNCEDHGYCATNFKGNGIMDMSGHGTHCAGIIGASGLNGIHGVIDQSVQMIGVKVQDDDTGYIWLSSEIKGWQWLMQAKQIGVDVRAVNVSIGGNYTSRSERMAVAAADSAGITTIFASANDSKNVDLDLADTAMVRSGSVLNVNAIEASGNASPFTNYGKTQTDLYAPGSAVLSTAAGGVRTFNAFCAAQDSSRTVVYEGFEDAGSADADVNGGLDFHYYDENQTDFCGQAVTVGDTCYSGARGLDIPAAGQKTVTIISKPVTLAALNTNEQLYRGFCMWSESERIQIKCDFMLADGSFSDTAAEDMGTYQWRNSGNAGNGGSNLQQLPDDVDFGNFQMKITITFTDTANTLHLDSIGVGTGLDSYTVYGGTSMAAPAVTGAFALLASNHPEECSAKISGRILGGAYDRDAFADTCVSGGQLNIDKANTDPDPAIQLAISEGNTVVLEGWFIGENQGSVTIGGQNAEIITWREDTATDIGRITVKLPEGLTGAQMAVVTDAAGQSGSRQILLPTDGAYEDLSLPTDPAYDNIGITGLAALGEDVYLLGGDIVTDATTLWQYNTSRNTWTNLGPTEIETSFFCQIVGHDGKLYATSYETDPDTGRLAGRLWQYTLETKKWIQIETNADLPAVATPVSYQGNLLLVGGETYDNDGNLGLSNKILNVDVETGAVSTAVELPEGMEQARAAVSGDKLAIASCYTDSGTPFFGITDLNTVKRHDLPAVDAGQQMEMALGSTAEGFILTGLVSSAGGTWQDTWYYNLASGNFGDAGKTLSAAKTFRNVGVTVGDTFYVWGQSSQVDGLSFFRKTTVPANYVLTPSVNDAAMGSITPDQPVTLQQGQSQTFTATAKVGYRMDHWLVNGEILSASQSIDVTADGHKKVEAVFARENRRVTTTPITIDAVAGKPIAEQRLTITLSGDRFRNLYIAQDITVMFSSMPAGLTATVVGVHDTISPLARLFFNVAYAAEAPTYLSGNTVEVAINGTPVGSGSFNLTMTIPGEYLESGVAIAGAPSGEMTINEVNPSDEPADYSKVDAAIAKIPADLSVYTDATVKALNDAKNAVVMGKKMAEQKVVDGYATAIENAISGLIKKSDTKSPQAGDESNMFAWIALMFISGGAVAVLGVAKKRRNS